MHASIKHFGRHNVSGLCARVHACFLKAFVECVRTSQAHGIRKQTGKRLRSPHSPHPRAAASTTMHATPRQQQQQQHIIITIWYDDVCAMCMHIIVPVSMCNWHSCSHVHMRVYVCLLVQFAKQQKQSVLKTTVSTSVCVWFIYYMLRELYPCTVRFYVQITHARLQSTNAGWLAHWLGTERIGRVERIVFSVFAVHSKRKKSHSMTESGTAPQRRPMIRKRLFHNTHYMLQTDEHMRTKNRHSFKGWAILI